MFVFILILLLLASITGVLGAVLKVTAILFLAGLLTITLLIAFGWWMIKRGMRQYATGRPLGSGPRPAEPGPTIRGNVVDTEGRIKDD